MDVKSFATTGGGEPFMYKQLPEFYEYAKEYAASVGKDIRVFIPTSGLGTIFRDDEALTRVIKNTDLLRFSLDSFDKEFLCDTHGINENQYEEVMQNVDKTIAIAKEVNPDIDIEVLILMYE